MADRSEQTGDLYSLVPDPALQVETTEAVSTNPVVSEQEAAHQPSMSWMLLRELAETIILSVVIFLLIRQVVQNYRIESLSMEPNFYEGQFILVNKLAYKLGEPERGDVLVFHNPRNPDEDYIKRIIGLPGDTLEMREQTVYLNNKPLEESFPHNLMAPGTRYGPIVVEPDRLFVMGDNRPNSEDSREFGPVDEALVVGQAWLRVWPLDQFGLVGHYDLEPDAAVAEGSTR